MLNDGYFSDFQEKLSSFTMKKLCEIIVIDRYLGSLNKEAVMCMQELAKRRENGDMFDYELFIDNESKKLPIFKIDLNQKMRVGYDLSILKNVK